MYSFVVVYGPHRDGVDVNSEENGLKHLNLLTCSRCVYLVGRKGCRILRKVKVNTWFYSRAGSDRIFDRQSS